MKDGTLLALSASMKTLIIVSKCLRVTKFNSLESNCEFHFKGVCAGELLRKVILRTQNDIEVRKGEEYLMYVQMHSFQNGILKGQVIKLRKLDECWDKS